MRNLLLLICSLIFAQHGVNANGHLQDYVDIVVNNIDDDVLDLADNVDNHHQRVLDPTPPDTAVNPVAFKEIPLLLQILSLKSKWFSMMVHLSQHQKTNMRIFFGHQKEEQGT